MGSSSIISPTVAASTITWPAPVESTASTGTIDYVTANPTTFIASSSKETYDWMHGNDNTRWKSAKTIYDPCPFGWRVPNGGSEGIWAKALGSDSHITHTYDNSNKGHDFTGKFGTDPVIWYPAPGYIDNQGSLQRTGLDGKYWSVTPHSDSINISHLYIYYQDYVHPADSNSGFKACGFSVRCVHDAY